MKLSLKGEYALRAMLVLGLHHGEGILSITTISNEQNIPKRFLEQILADLKSVGLVESRRGNRGGYQLGRPPERISLAEIVRHVEGALAPISCVSQNFYEKCSCPDESRCAIRSVMQEIRDAIVALAQKTSLADICARARTLNSVTAALDFTI